MSGEPVDPTMTELERIWATDESAPAPQAPRTEKQKAWDREKAYTRAERHKPIPLSDEDVKPAELAGRAARRARERDAKAEKRSRSRIQRHAAHRGVRRAYQ